MREKPLSSTQLTTAQKQIIGQIGVAADNFENNALNMAKTYLHYNKYEEPQEVYKRIQSLTSQDLWEVANEMFCEENLSTLIYL